MTARVRTLIVLMITMLAWNCKEPFEPEIPYEQTNFLVVEGYINVGPGKTSIRLSRTTKVNETIRQVFENDASVRIEGEDGTTYPLDFEDKGLYTSAELNLPSTFRYRLRISIGEIDEYVSDYALPIVTPPIDSVNWEYKFDGLHIYVNTHDFENDTRFYQWSFEETWKVESDYVANYSFTDGTIKPKPLDQVFLGQDCWKSDVQTGLNFSTTANLSANVVTERPVTVIVKGTERLQRRYSILVKQNALSEENFDFLSLMEKNTGAMGTFSDPQPSQLRGNIKSVNSSEPVVGFVGAYTTQTKRIYIDKREVPDWGFSYGCVEKTVYNHPDSIMKYFIVQKLVPTAPVAGDIESGWLIFKASVAPCADCRLRGADINEPDFWEE